MAARNIEWIEKLGYLDVAKILFKGLFFPERKVFYDKNRNTKGVSLAVRILKAAGLCRNLHEAELSLNVKDEDGKAYIYRFYEDIDRCFDYLCQRYLPHEAELCRGVFKAYVSPYILDSIRFASMVEAKKEIDGPGQEGIVKLSGGPFSGILADSYKDRGLEVRISSGIASTVKYFLRPANYAAAFLFSRIAPEKVRSNITEAKPSIWIDYAPWDNFDRFFWKEEVDSEKFQTVCYFDRKGSRATKEAVENLEKDGLKWIDAGFLSSLRASRVTIAEFSKLFLEAFFRKNNASFRVKIFRFEYGLWFLIYKSIFRRFNVRVLIQHKDTFWRCATQAAAIEAAGGIMIGYNWSNLPMNFKSTHHYPQHVFFVWGEAIRKFMKGSPYTVFLPSGIWIAERDKDRNRLSNFSGPADFVMAVFDSSASYDIHQSPHNLSLFYLKILDLLERERRWTGLIKSKNWEGDEFEDLPSGKTIMDRIRALAVSGRLHILPKTFSPLTASKAADLSVCYGLNSAGIIAGAYGRKAIHWDCSGWVDHPFYKDPAQKIVFASLEGFEAAIRRAAGGDSSIGDFSKWQKEFNFFQDSDGGTRIGRFISSFLDSGLDRGDVKRLLKRSIEKYIKENGIGADFSIPKKVKGANLQRTENEIYNRI